MTDPESPFSFRLWWQALTKEQRFSIAALLVCCVVAFGLSLTQLKTQVSSPFRLSKEKAIASQKFFAEQEAAARSIDALKRKDTDGDGLSDYAEWYLYRTSPYLADSDSDEILDSIEIAQGADPNCPQGKTCFQIANTVPAFSASSSFGEFLDVAPVSASQVAAEAGASLTLSGAQGFLQRPPDPSTLTPAQIRQYLLVNQLVSQDELSLLPDSAVKEVYTAAYQQALRISESAAGTIPGIPTSTGVAATGSLLLPTPILDEP